MSVRALLRRHDTPGTLDAPVAQTAGEQTASRAASDVRALERLDRWIEGGDEGTATALGGGIANGDRSLLGAPADRLGKSALRMVAAEARKEAASAANEAAGELARRATAKVTRFFDGILESSPVAVEPNFTAIKARTKAALDEARTSLGREPTPQEAEAIRRCVYDVWAEAAGSTGA